MALKIKQHKQQKSRHAEYKKRQNQRQQYQNNHKKALLLAGEGTKLAKLGQYAAAIKKFQQALQIEPFSVPIITNYGNVLADSGRYEEGFIQFRRALEIDPNSFITLIDYGVSLSDLALYEEAIIQYQKAIKISPNSALAMGCYGGALAGLNRYEEAAIQFGEALKIDPDNFLTLKHYADSLTILERYEEALIHYQRALQIHPTSAEILINYANSLSELGRYEEAVTQYIHALQIAPNSVIALKGYGNSLTKLKRYNEAVIQYHRVLEIEPTSVNALIYYANSLADLEQYEDAIKQYRRALKISADDFIVLFNYAMALMKTQRYNAAIDIFLQIPSNKKVPENILTATYTWLGILCHQIKLENEGGKYLKLAIQYASDKDGIRIFAAQNLFSQKPFSKAGLSLLKEVAATSPHYRKAFETLKFNLDIEAFFDMFNAPSPDDFQDTRELYRAIYHKMINELFILKGILYEMEVDAGSNAAPITSIIQRVEAMLAELNAKRDEEKINLRQIPEHDYQRMLELIAQTAHDISDVINNSFFRLKADILLLREETLPNSPLAQQIERIFTHIETTERALNDLKSVQEGIALHSSTFAIKDIVETWQQTPKFQNASIELNVHDGDAEFYGDLPKIRSMVNELIENAVKHNAEQTNLHIRITTQKTTNPISVESFTGENQTYLHITISDNGKGIPDEKKEWIFLPMKTTAPQHGSGLGLFIIKRTVNAMGGNIAETGKFGEGTRFEIYLPWKETHERRA